MSILRITGAIALLIAACSGCAQRTLEVDSEPSGALVYLNGEEAGRTPFRHDFTFYGNYDVVIRKEGYETVKTSRLLKAPFWETVPFDLLGELFGHKDVQKWTFQLQPAHGVNVDPQELVARGAELRGELRSSKYTRTPSTLPATQPATRPATRPAE